MVVVVVVIVISICGHKHLIFFSSLINSALYITFLQVKDSPCLAGTPSSDEVEKKNHKHN